MKSRTLILTDYELQFRLDSSLTKEGNQFRAVIATNRHTTANKVLNNPVMMYFEADNWEEAEANLQNRLWVTRAIVRVTLGYSDGLPEYLSSMRSYIPYFIDTLKKQTSSLAQLMIHT